jgi:hypothetical protein
MGCCDIFTMCERVIGGKFRRLRQAKLLDSLPDGHESKKGVCRAIAMTHCGLRKIGTSIGAAAGHDKGTSPEKRDQYEAALAQWTSKVQDDMATIEKAAKGAADLGTALEDLYKRQAPIVGLAFEALWTKKWECVKEIYDAVALSPAAYYLQVILDAVALSPAAYYLQVILPNHVVAVFRFDEARYGIYDPNCGELEVPAAQLHKALGFILTHPVLVQKYQLAKDTAVYFALLK